jgi:hypothetical protein
VNTFELVLDGHESTGAFLLGGQVQAEVADRPLPLGMDERDIKGVI